MAGELQFELPLIELRRKINELKRIAEKDEMNLSDSIEAQEKIYEELEREIYSNLKTQDKMQLARHAQRPTTADLIQAMCTDYVELHGDRLFRDDLAIVGGIARLDDMPITVVGHQKGKDTKDNVARFFGMPHPEGFRKALRLMQQADKFDRPILTFIDTPGAYPGNAAEERGQGEAIARNLKAMASFGVPIICVIVGEGGSGGALALGVGNRVLMLEHAIYSVSSPEAAASIIYKDATKNLLAAEAMKITSDHMLAFGIIDEIVPEPRGGAHRNLQATADAIKELVLKHLQELKPMSHEQLVQDRFARFRKYGSFKI